LRLELKACAELALKDSASALDDVKLALYLADTVKEEPFLISWLVRAACLQVAIGPVWEGLAEHRWSDSQLQELQGRFEHYDSAPALERCLHAERAFGVLTVDLIGKRDWPYFSTDTGDLPLGEYLFQSHARFIARLAPSGWWDQEKLQYCRLFDLEFQGAWDPAGRTFSPSQINSNSVALGDSISTGFQTILHHRLIAKLLLPALGRTLFKAATVQTATDQAAIACALERYRLANGQFPEELQALTPKFLSSLPNGVITGKPYEYRRTADGQFTLNSAGADDKDASVTSGKGLLNQMSQWFAIKKGDWLWSYPRG
jgi:hypothetical protein